MSKKKRTPEVLSSLKESDVLYFKIKSIFDGCLEISEVFVKNHTVYYHPGSGGQRITRREFFTNIEQKNE